MSAPSSAFSRCARRAAQRGAAVVLALLTVSFAAMLAAAALADFGHGLDMLGGRHDQAQAWQLGRAAVDWSRTTAVGLLAGCRAARSRPAPYHTK